jgi:UDP-N-acetylglucosamine/UDP-N-acetylgalactosamine diphosphorylase
LAFGPKTETVEVSHSVNPSEPNRPLGTPRQPIDHNYSSISYSPSVPSQLSHSSSDTSKFRSMAGAMKGVHNLFDDLHMTAKGAPPREPTSQEVDALKEKYKSAGQDHVFAFYESLGTAEKASLYEQLSNINPAYINQIAEKALKPATKEQFEVTLEPLPESATASILDSKQEDLKRWYASGLNLVAQNKVAVVLMAGGQGTRLGSAAPKGCFDIGLHSGKSLFQIQAERILRIQQLASKERQEGGNVVVPWYVMTSGPTRGPTEKFFEEHGYFGLEKDNVFIFEQGVLPCISNEGKILMESKAKVRIKPFTPYIKFNLISKSQLGRSRTRWQWWHLQSSLYVFCDIRYEHSWY